MTTPTRVNQRQSTMSGHQLYASQREPIVPLLLPPALACPCAQPAYPVYQHRATYHCMHSRPVNAASARAARYGHTLTVGNNLCTAIQPHTSATPVLYLKIDSIASRSGVCAWQLSDFRAWWRAGSVDPILTCIGQGYHLCETWHQPLHLLWLTHCV